MKAVTTTIYECEFCCKYYRRKHFCERHEMGCRRNPENYRACFDCVYLINKDITVETGDYDHKYAGRATVLYCLRFDKGVYPPKVERSQFGAWPDIENDPMPKECESRKARYSDVEVFPI